MRSIGNSFIFVFFYLLPKNWVSCLIGRLAGMRLPRVMTLAIIKGFSRRYKVDVNEAEKPLKDYKTVQEFFTRKLKPGKRPLPIDTNIIISPCDGVMSMASEMRDGVLIQAKGRDFLLSDLLKNTSLANRFMNGFYATLYLSPRDYHRFHVPMDGDIIETIHVPGSLWPVNGWAVHNVKDLFCINERVITIIKERMSNLWLAHIAIGATMVGKIELEYCDLSAVSDHRSKKITAVAHDKIPVKHGEELGKFMFGSTIVMLFEPGLINGCLKNAPSSVKMGEALAQLAQKLPQ